MSRPPVWVHTLSEPHREYVTRYMPGPGGGAVLLAIWAGWARGLARLIARHARAAAAAIHAYRRSIHA